MKTLRIGNASAYWGDDPKALERQVRGGGLHYITQDFLAELTMSILQKQRAADPQAGYARDFISQLLPLLPEILKQKIGIISNAGGVNPSSCAKTLSEAMKAKNLSAKIAVVDGDSILAQLPELAKKIPFSNIETGEPFSAISQRVCAANAYLGAQPIVEALKLGADIVITGRVADASLTLAPMIYKFGWSETDWNKLASGIIAGHILECGAQACGGNFTDWIQVKDFSNMGFPIVEMESDGTFNITKHKGTGGLVSCETVKEQLLYEIGDPSSYITPDVIADFTSIKMSQVGPDCVRISEVRGYSATDSYKVSLCYDDGFKCHGTLIVSGPDALEKARSLASQFWKGVGQTFSETKTEYFGWDACQGSLGHPQIANEILLRLSARSTDKKALQAFAKYVPSLVTSGPPGITYTGGLPQIQDVLGFWPTLVPKSEVNARVALFGKEARTLPAPVYSSKTAKSSPKTQVAQKATPKPKTSSTTGVPLSKICFARSGDKGDSVNLGVLARSPKAFAYLEKNLTAQKVKDLYHELCAGKVTRFTLENLSGFNFLLEKALGGGGMRSLRIDTLGKTFAQALLRQKFKIPEAVLKEVKKHHGKRRTRV